MKGRHMSTRKSQRIAGFRERLALQFERLDRRQLLAGADDGELAGPARALPSGLDKESAAESAVYVSSRRVNDEHAPAQTRLGPRNPAFAIDSDNAVDPRNMTRGAWVDLKADPPVRPAASAFEPSTSPTGTSSQTTAGDSATPEGKIRSQSCSLKVLAHPVDDQHLKLVGGPDSDDGDQDDPPLRDEEYCLQVALYAIGDVLAGRTIATGSGPAWGLRSSTAGTEPTQAWLAMRMAPDEPASVQSLRMTGPEGRLIETISMTPEAGHAEPVGAPETTGSRGEQAPYYLGGLQRQDTFLERPALQSGNHLGLLDGHQRFALYSGEPAQTGTAVARRVLPETRGAWVLSGTGSGAKVVAGIDGADDTGFAGFEAGWVNEGLCQGNTPDSREGMQLQSAIFALHPRGSDVDCLKENLTGRFKLAGELPVQDGLEAWSLLDEVARLTGGPGLREGVACRTFDKAELLPVAIMLFGSIGQTAPDRDHHARRRAVQYPRRNGRGPQDHSADGPA